MKINRKGFTLIELLVVIAIIGLLSTLAIISLNNARQKSRDARRVSDIKQIQTALELYFNDKDGYAPDAGDNGSDLGAAGATTLSSGNGWADTTSDTVYMANVPANPTPGGITYEYNAIPNGCDNSATYCSSYTIEFDLESAISSLGSGTDCQASSTAMNCV